MNKTNLSSDNSNQSQKFIDKAKELGADEDEKSFDDKLRRIARQKPKEDKPAD